MNKIAIASDMLKAIRGLELSPTEVKCLTLTWLSYYPFLLEDFGWEIQIHAHVQNILAEIEKLQAIMLNANNTEISAEEPLSAVDVTSEVAPETQQKTSPEDEIDASEPKDEEGAENSIVSSETPLTDANTASFKTEVPTETEESLKPDIPPELPAPAESEIQIAPRKGYSKYGKKLGRPPRRKSEEETNKITPEKKADRKTQKVPASEKQTKKTSAEITSAVIEPTDISPPTVQPDEVTQDVIDRLKYGKEYEYDLLYLVDKLYARSRFKLREDAGVKPVGVIIPYVHQNLPYEIVVYYADEHAIIPINIARKYAKSKLLPYKKMSWRIKNPSDDAHIRPVLATINEIFKKMGGDELKGTYVDGRGEQYYDTKIDALHKIRYVCNIPLFDPQEK